MADSRIERTDLWDRLVRIKKKDIWIRAVEELGLRVTRSKGGTSHCAIRLPNYENWDIKGVVSTIYDPVRKDISEAIFKSLLDHGYREDCIWRALRFIK